MNASEAVEAMELYGLHTLHTDNGWLAYYEGQCKGAGQTLIAAVEAAAESVSGVSRLPVVQAPYDDVA